MQWRYEGMYVMRNDQGVIIRIEEEQPEGFEHPELPKEEKDQLRYRVIGD
ncbi:hypothetical protein [Paenibacillus whitsoniae]|nr:hypothetical protein [Paenibacillus whitsoniae]